MNKGSACIEATLIMPIFIAAMVSIYCMGKVKMTELVMYEAVAECSEYTAESAYINSLNITAPGIYLENYVDSKELVNKYIDGGIDGVSFLGSYISDMREVMLHANYTVEVNLPFLPVLSKDKSIVIQQRGYTGDSVAQEGEVDEDCIYVYITDNQGVYHSSRLCTYLNLSVMLVESSTARQKGYDQCRLCGDKCGEMVYVTDYGGRYHSSQSCSGLKRTIHRIKKGEVGDLVECSRCNKNYGY